jgi:cytochrome c
MFYKISRTLLVAFSLVILSFTAQANDRGTTEEAKAMCEKAAAFLVENGIEKAKEAFQAPGAP